MPMTLSWESSDFLNLLPAPMTRDKRNKPSERGRQGK